MACPALVIQAVLLWVIAVMTFWMPAQTKPAAVVIALEIALT
jgi:hypothetical protein